jgi:hypothetical protein
MFIQESPIMFIQESSMVKVEKDRSSLSRVLLPKPVHFWRTDVPVRAGPLLSPLFNAEQMEGHFRKAIHECVNRVKETAEHMRKNAEAVGKHQFSKDESRARALAAAYMDELAASLLFEISANDDHQTPTP